jgi:hypothetical protein
MPMMQCGDKRSKAEGLRQRSNKQISCAQDG